MYKVCAILLHSKVAIIDEILDMTDILLDMLEKSGARIQISKQNKLEGTKVNYLGFVVSAKIICMDNICRIALFKFSTPRETKTLD